MKEKLGCAAIVAYFGIGTIQLLAMIKGIQLWTGMPWLIAAVISLFVAYIPLVGTIGGIKGATDGWGWSFWTAVAFFVWPYLLYGIAILSGGVADVMSRRRDEQ